MGCDESLRYPERSSLVICQEQHAPLRRGSLQRHEFVPAFAVASLLTLLALVTLVAPIAYL
jgi:hypothetical protein